MKRGRIHTLLLVIILAGMVTLLASCKAARHGKHGQFPNIVLIISDDQGWTDYSFMGHPFIETPSIDRLAREGLTFTRGYSAAPLCRPSLASIITGLYPRQHGIVGNDPVFPYPGEKKWGEEWLVARKPYNDACIGRISGTGTLPSLLKERGYVSLQTGKWWEGHYSTGGFDMGMTHGDPRENGRHGDHGLAIGREGLEVIYDFIEEADRNHHPFFIWYAPFMPHAPHTPPDTLEEKYMERAPTAPVARYWAMCEWFDHTCGELVNHIDRQGMGGNTLFIYVTDNGWIQQEDLPNRYAPRSKRSPYEMGIRTPVILRWSGTITPGMDTIHPVSSVDIATTLLAACGLPPSRGMQGIDMLDMEELAARDAIFAENHTHDFTTPDSSLLQEIVVSGGWKLILHDSVNDPGMGPELYDLKKDPHEMHDLAQERPGLVQDLLVKMARWKDHENE